MDTVGAWLVHKLERDRGAKIVGATEEQQLLIDHVTQADQPVKVKRDYEIAAAPRASARSAPRPMMAMRTLVGLLGFFGALLISTWQHHPPSRAASASTRSPSNSRWSACTRSASSA